MRDEVAAAEGTTSRAHPPGRLRTTLRTRVLPVANKTWRVLYRVFLLPWKPGDVVAVIGLVIIVVTVWHGCVVLNGGGAFADNDPLISSFVESVPPSWYGHLIPETTDGSGLVSGERAQLSGLGASPSTCQAYDERQYLLHAYACSLKAVHGESHLPGNYVLFFFDGRYIGRDAWAPSHRLYLGGRTGSEITVYFEMYQNSGYGVDTGASSSVTYQVQTNGECPPRAIDKQSCMSPEQPIPPLATASKPGR